MIKHCLLTFTMCAMCFSYSSLAEYADATGMVEKTAPSDGHCILHSVSKAMALEMGITRSVQEIFQHVTKELCDHSEHYAHFTPKDKDIVAEVLEWSKDKNYDRDSVDLIINVLCNCFAISMRVAEVYQDMVRETTQVPGRGISSSGMITILKRGNHYNYFCYPDVKDGLATIPLKPSDRLVTVPPKPSDGPVTATTKASPAVEDTSPSHLQTKQEEWKIHKNKKRPRDQAAQHSPVLIHNRYAVLETVTCGDPQPSPSKSPTKKKTENRKGVEVGAETFG